MSLKPTPQYAKSISELPKVKGNESRRDVIVDTNEGAKRYPVDQLMYQANLLIGTYQYYGAQFPADTCVPLLGGILYPHDFEDKLETFKSRIPADWILSNGSVQLPNVQDRLLQFDPDLWIGSMENDAMQDFDISLHQSGSSNTGTFTCLSKYITGAPTGSFSYSYGGSKYVLVGSAIVAHREFYDVTIRHNQRSATASLQVGHRRTANKTRESTINAMLCMVVGKVISTEKKKYKLTSSYAVPHIVFELAIGRNNAPIGYSPYIKPAVREDGDL